MMTVLDEALGTRSHRHITQETTQSISIFLDVDGTLLDTPATPGEVRVPPNLPRILTRLHRALDGMLALISGRPIAELDKLFAPAVLPAAGEHGAELRLAPGRMFTVPVEDERLDDLQHRLETVVARFPDARMQRKRTALTVSHHGPVQERTALSAGIRRAMGGGFPGLHILRGRAGLEIKPRQCTKGKAIATLLQYPPFLGTNPMFVGDYASGDEAFETVWRLGGAGIPVGSPVDPGGFASPAGVRAWLAEITGA